MVVNHLADMAVDVSDQTSAQLQENIDRALAVLTGNLESISSNAQLEVNSVIDETNEMIQSNPDCMPTWHLQEFTANVTQQLSMCTFDAERMIIAYREEGEQAMAEVQSFVQQLGQLPMLCQGQLMGTALAPLTPLGLDLTSGSAGNSCFMEGITRINQGLAQAMHNASLLLVRTRQLSQEQMTGAQECSAAVVRQVTEYLSEQRANCS